MCTLMVSPLGPLFFYFILFFLKYFLSTPPFTKKKQEILKLYIKFKIETHYFKRFNRFLIIVPFRRMFQPNLPNKKLHVASNYEHKPLDLSS